MSEKYEAQKSYRQRQRAAAAQQREGKAEALELFGRMVAALEQKTLVDDKNLEYQRGIIEGQKLFLNNIFDVSDEELQAIAQKVAAEIKALNPPSSPPPKSKSKRVAPRAT